MYDLGYNLAPLLVLVGAIILIRKAWNTSADTKKAAAKGGLALLQWLFKK